MIASAHELRPGQVLDIETEAWKLLKVETKQSKIRAHVRSLHTKISKELTFNPDDKVEFVILERKEVSLSFMSGATYTFMDVVDYTMYELQEEDLGDALRYIEEGMEDVCDLVFHAIVPIGLELPRKINRKVVATKSSTRDGKPSSVATLASGAEIDVPLFVQQDEFIEIDTRDGTFLGGARRH